MPNITVDQAKLVLNSFAAIFQNNLITADAVTWKEYDTQLNDRNALTVSEQVGPRYKVVQTSSGVADYTSSGTQDSVFGSEQFTVNQTFGTSMGWGDFQKIQSVGEARESEALKNAATNLAEVIDSYVLGVASTASDNWVGTPANSLSTFNDVVSGYTRLKEEGVDDSDLRVIGNFSDKQSLGSSVTTLPALDDLASVMYRQGFNGEVGGLPIVFTQQLPNFTTGSRAASGAGSVNGANQNVNYSAVAVSGAPGQYMTQTLIIKTSASGTETTKAGDVFTIAGVNAYDNRAQADLGRLQQFVVVTGATSVSGSQTIRIFPAIIVPGSGGGSAANVNTAHATVTAAPIDTAAIVWVGAASTTYKPRLVLQKQAIVVNTAPLIMPATGKAAQRALTKVPLTVRMWQNSTFNTGEHDVRFDVALTANIKDRRRIVRVNGA